MMKCYKDNVDLVIKEQVFSYMDHEMTYPVLTCPVCGQVFIPPNLARGKMADLEKELEDK